MTASDKAALKAAYPEHYFCRVIHEPTQHECIVAIPKRQRDETHEQAAALYHGATVRFR